VSEVHSVIAGVPRESPRERARESTKQARSLSRLDLFRLVSRVRIRAVSPARELRLHSYALVPQ
jgi:hypothetical protein